MNHIVIIDNYDSFTYNLCHIVREAGADVSVLRNDRFAPEALETFDKIILSPGPGIPQEAGLLCEVIRRYAGRKPMLGICLGEQAIAEVFGARLINLAQVYHGVQTAVRRVADDYIFTGLPATIKAGRYHSWAVAADSLPDCLEITCTDEQGCIMALRHKEYDIHGIQFHPESVLTPQGELILRNFLNH